MDSRHSLVLSIQQQKQKFDHGTKKYQKTFHSKSYFTRFCRLISNILWKIVGLFLPSPVEISNFTVPALNDLLQDYDFVMIIKGDFNDTKKLVYGILVKDSYRAWDTCSVYLKSFGSISFIISKVTFIYIYIYIFWRKTYRSYHIFSPM